LNGRASIAGIAGIADVYRGCVSATLQLSCWYAVVTPLALVPSREQYQ